MGIMAFISEDCGKDDYNCKLILLSHSWDLNSQPLCTLQLVVSLITIVAQTILVTKKEFLMLLYIEHLLYSSALTHAKHFI